MQPCSKTSKEIPLLLSKNLTLSNFFRRRIHQSPSNNLREGLLPTMLHGQPRVVWDCCSQLTGKPSPLFSYLPLFLVRICRKFDRGIHIFAEPPLCSVTLDLHSRLLPSVVLPLAPSLGPGLLQPVVPALAPPLGLIVLLRVSLLQSPGRLLGSEWESC